MIDWPNLVEIDVENSHREIVGQFALILILENDPKELIPEIKLAGIVLTRACLYLKRGIIERALEIGVELADLFGLQKTSPMELGSALAVSASGMQASWL